VLEEREEQRRVSIGFSATLFVTADRRRFAALAAQARLRGMQAETSEPGESATAAAGARPLYARVRLRAAVRAPRRLLMTTKARIATQRAQLHAGAWHGTSCQGCHAAAVPDKRADQARRPAA
jgi:hypothetical protein